MTEDTSLDIVTKVEEDKIKYASEVIKIDFLSDYIRTVSNKKIMYLNEHADRVDAISRFSTALKDIDAALRIEAGLFEFAIIHCSTNNLISEMLTAVYNSHAYDLLQNLNPTSPVGNKYLINAIAAGEIEPQMIAFMKPHQLHPDRWSDIIKKNNLREDKKKNMAVTDLYQCWKCKERRCRIMELQTRSSDEPITKFITCMNCFTVMKK